MPTPELGKDSENAGAECLEPRILVFSSDAPQGLVRLEIRGEPARSFAGIGALPAFPLTAPGRMIQLYALKETGMQGEMIGLLEDLAALPPAARELLENLIRRNRMLPAILRIDRLCDEWHSFHWHVQTDRGAHDFFTGSPREAIQHGDNGRLLIEDLAENRYLVPDWRALDARSRQLLDQAT